MSGRMKYRKAKLAEGYMEEDIKLNWKRLPHEGKTHWNILGRGLKPKAPLSILRRQRRMLKSGQMAELQPKALGNLNWMSETA